MFEGIAEFFANQGYMPHGHCYLWNPPLVGVHVISDALIGMAYVSISASLYILIRTIKIPFSAMVLSFGIFIGACGATHFMEIWNLWFADYWMAGFIKVITAIASVATGIWLIKLKPQIITFAKEARLSEERRLGLETANRGLEEAAAALKVTNDTLKEQQNILSHSAKMSALGEMAGGIAHEINSPLAIITVRANQLERMLKRGDLSPERIVSEAQLIAKTAKRIGAITAGLRSFAREGDKDPFVPVTLSAVLEDTLVLCQHDLPITKSDFSCPTPPQPRRSSAGRYRSVRYF